MGALQEFVEYFETVDDPRVEGRCDHPLHTILFLSVAATIAGADGPADIAEFGRQQREWLKQFANVDNGIPSHDTIGRVLSLIKPDQFQQALLAWLGSLAELKDDRGAPIFVPIDGKTARGSYSRADKSDMLHIVSAWASAQGLTLGQVAVDSKSNEITAIPKLLKMLELQGAIVSLDAMGCQKEIAAQIQSQGGDYTIAVKDNQPSLAEAIEQAFVDGYECDFAGCNARRKTTRETSRGREEERRYTIMPLPESMAQFAGKWSGLRSIGQVIRTVQRGGEESCEVSYYITSLPAKVRLFCDSVRNHWRIENELHWVMDVVFGEDASRIRDGHAAENMSFLRRFVISLLKQDTSRDSLKRKRKKAGWNTDFLEKLLFQKRI